MPDEITGARDRLPTVSTAAVGKLLGDALKTLEGLKYKSPVTLKGRGPLATKTTAAASDETLQKLYEKLPAEEKAKQPARDQYLATVEAQADGTFKPPQDAPKTYHELKKTKRPTADWPADKFVTLDGKNYTFSRGTWRLAKQQPK